MGKLINGINGPFSGKVGSVVGYVSRGKPLMRGLPDISKSRKPSLLQAQQRVKFSLMNKFLGPIIPFLNITNKTDNPDLSGYNKAFSYNVKNAVSGSFPDLVIKYEMALLTRGDLPNIKQSEVRSQPPGNIMFSWTDNSGSGQARSNDKAFVSIYCPEIVNGWVYGLDLAERSEGRLIFDLANFTGRLVHTYIGFLSANGNEVSDSLYVGSVHVG
ncbi:MAG TPA: DUF6266 family protein [Puia sp.]|nr:DUF6266 family protein [Puia sp.]